MIQQESLPVWGYGRGQVRTVARVTYRGGVGDEADPAEYTTIGAMQFTRQGVGRYQVLIDVAGPSELRYIAARILHAAQDYLQAQCVIDPTVSPIGSALAVQIWNVNPPAGNDVPADLDQDAALCIDVIVDQTGDLAFSLGNQLPPAPPPPVPAPLPRPPILRLPGVPTP